MSLPIFLLCLAVCTVGIFFAIAGFRGAVWVPARTADLNAIVKRLKYKKGARVYEFGCGDARFLRLAAKRHTITGIGYEINPTMALVARMLTYRTNITIEVGDAWTKPFSDADVVFAFLMPAFMQRFGEKMNNELTPGTIVVTYIYPIPNMRHYYHEANAYFYTIQ